MKYSKIYRILAVVLLFALLVVMVPSKPALAVAYLYVHPASGEIGDEFELYGTAFAMNTVYDIYFSDERASVGGDIDEDVLNYEYLGEIMTEADATFVEYYFYVPNRLTDGDEVEKVHGGDYWVYATFEGQDRIKARVKFTVEFTAVINLDPEEGTVGTEVEVTGEGYDDREDIAVEYDGRSLDIESGDEDTDSNGEFEFITLIPESTAGAHTITVTGDDSNVEAEAEFTVEPKMTITPESGAVGDTITVSGTGFGGEVEVIITLDGTQVAQKETDDDGSFTVTFAAPSRAAGSYDIAAEDDDDNSDEASFTIAATVVNLSPTTGNVGDNVNVSGSGFQANESISITFDNVPVKTVSTDSDGTFTDSFIVPIRVADTYTVRVDDGTNMAEADFSISTTASISPVTSTASPGHVGSELAVSGVGFTPGGTVTVTYDDDTQLATASVDSNGTFSATFTVPTSSAGEHKIIATDVINTREFKFFMEANPPSTVYPQLPLMNSKLEDWRFDWCGDATDLSKEVTDYSLPITYTLQIATDENFSEDSTVLEKTGLTESEYTITKEERLESVSEETPYYWKVKATDSASNEKWSGVGAFYVGGFSWSLSQGVIYTLIGVGAFLFAIFTFWLGRKTAYY